MATDPAYDPVRALNPAFAAVRTALHVPMLKEVRLLGAIVIYRDQWRLIPNAEFRPIQTIDGHLALFGADASAISQIDKHLHELLASQSENNAADPVTGQGDLAPGIVGGSV